MNLSAVGAGSRTVEAFVSEINEETDPAGHCYPSRPRQRASADANIEEASVNLLGHRHVNRPHSSVAVVSQYTDPAHDVPRRASGARHPELVSVHIHTV
jgi:hypothetical protein